MATIKVASQHVGIRKKLDASYQASATLTVWMPIPGYDEGGVRHTKLVFTGIGNAGGQLEAIKDALEHAHHLIYLFKVELEDEIDG